MFIDNRYSFRPRSTVKVIVALILFLCIGTCAIISVYNYYWENIFIPDGNGYNEVGEHFALAMLGNNAKKAKQLSSQANWNEIDEWMAKRTPCHNSFFEMLDNHYWDSLGGVQDHYIWCYEPGYRFHISLEFEFTERGWVVSKWDEVCDDFNKNQACK